MTSFEADSPPRPATAAATREYLLEMIKEMAILARKAGEPAVAVHLEAILAAKRAGKRAHAHTG